MNSYLAELEADPMLLTRRERQIAALTAHGMRVRSIAESLDLTDKTVENAIRSVYQKLGMNDRVALTRWAIKRQVDMMTPASLRARRRRIGGISGSPDGTG